jgi:hypothetical protein
MKAIETNYNGYAFRSRLEARWAVFFDTLGIEYEYEKEGFDLGAAGWYLPDFWLPLQRAWVEIKGDDATDEDVAKMRALALGTKQPVWVFIGPPSLSLHSAHERGAVPLVDDIIYRGRIASHLYCFQPLDDPGGVYGPRMTRATYITEAMQCPEDYGGMERIRKVLEDGGIVWSMGVHPWTPYPTSLLTCSDAEYHCAVLAARGARFEHGEAPLVPPQPSHPVPTPYAFHETHADDAMGDDLAVSVRCAVCDTSFTKDATQQGIPLCEDCDGCALCGGLLSAEQRQRGTPLCDTCSACGRCGNPIFEDNTFAKMR